MENNLCMASFETIKTLPKLSRDLKNRKSSWTASIPAISKLDAWLGGLNNVLLIILVSSNCTHILTSFGMIPNAYSALKYRNLQVFWSHKPLVFCTLGNAHFPLDLHLQELCKKASPADSGRNGDHRVHCHTPHCRGRENPTENLFDPKNALGRNQHCRYKRENHTLVLCSQSLRDLDNTAYFILDLDYTGSR